jgi:hypothetical protein
MVPIVDDQADRDCNVDAVLCVIDGADLHRAEIRSVLGTGFEIRRGPALPDFPVQLVFFNNLAERIVRILLEETRAGVPAGAAADACSPINTHFHDNPYPPLFMISRVRFSGLKILL